MIISDLHAKIEYKITCYIRHVIVGSKNCCIFTHSIEKCRTKILDIAETVTKIQCKLIVAYVCGNLCHTLRNHSENDYIAPKKILFIQFQRVFLK